MLFRYTLRNMYTRRNTNRLAPLHYMSTGRILTPSQEKTSLFSASDAGIPLFVILRIIAPAG
ncbi:hypothetical protein SODG_002218 [Sodalis praecaptivus]